MRSEFSLSNNNNVAYTHGCLCAYVCMVITYSKGKDQPGKVVNPARGQLNREINITLSAFAPENLVSRNEFGSPVPRQPVHLLTQAESGAYLGDSSRVSRRRPFIYFKPPYTIRPVSSLSGLMSFTAQNSPAQGQ